MTEDQQILTVAKGFEGLDMDQLATVSGVVVHEVLRRFGDRAGVAILAEIVKQSRQARAA